MKSNLSKFSNLLYKATVGSSTTLKQTYTRVGKAQIRQYYGSGKVAVTNGEEYLDLRSDTVTKPTEAMFKVMRNASVGDDVFGEDESIRNFERKVAQLSGHEAALFCTSGTLTNQLGLRTHLRDPPQSVLCDNRAHVYVYEAGGISFHSQAGVTPVVAKNGIHLTSEEILENLIDEDIHNAPTKVVSLENTCNGMIFPLEEIKKIRALTKERGIKLHLDGARLWNASVASNLPIYEYGAQFDSMSLCFSKGLGAPIGSVLVGNEKFIQKAKHFRKLFGGGWRQAGFLAAAGEYCLTEHLPLLSMDHQNASSLAGKLTEMGFDLVCPVHTNMVFFSSQSIGINMSDIIKELYDHKIRIMDYGKNRARVVFHHQIPQDAVEKITRVLERMVAKK
ncbi:Threonine aldolase [Basidiobolus ranarum]|uniref:Threonine aldolase n=1 Tax=Basidiobolus ranarum TaxID=34480 RepID=A0ABR2WZP8_9FUNG